RTRSSNGGTAGSRRVGACWVRRGAGRPPCFVGPPRRILSRAVGRAGGIRRALTPWERLLRCAARRPAVPRWVEEGSSEREAHLSAAPDPTQADARLSRADADSWGPCGAEPSSREGAQAGGRHHSLEVAPMPGPTGRFGSSDRLLRAAEFRKVGEEG